MEDHQFSGAAGSLPKKFQLSEKLATALQQPASSNRSTRSGGLVARAQTLKTRVKSQLSLNVFFLFGCKAILDPCHSKNC